LGRGEGWLGERAMIPRWRIKKYSFFPLLTFSSLPFPY